MQEYTTTNERMTALEALYRQLSIAERTRFELDYKRAAYPEGSREHAATTATMRCVQYRVNSLSDNIQILEEMLGIVRRD